MNNIRKTARMIFVALLFISMINLASAQLLYNTPSAYYGSYAQTYYGAVSPEQCQQGQGQDFIIQILPGSCSPSLVRSDLLEEQRVPVFCKLTGYKVNPLIQIPSIKSISIGGGVYPKDIESITFHPYRTALQTTYTQLVGTPFENELGYAVIFLKQNPTESTMPDEIVANLSARILYDTTTSFGIGDNELILPQLTDDQWNSEYRRYGFWYGKGYVRATQVKDDGATIQLYFDPTRPASTMTLSKTTPSQVVYLPGSYCSYGVKATLNDIIFPQTKAILDIDGNKVEAYQNMQIADGCRVKSITTADYDSRQQVTISCSGGDYVLERNAFKATVTINNVVNSYSVGSSVNIGQDSYTVVFIGRSVNQSGTTQTIQNVVAFEKDSDLSSNRDAAITAANTQIKDLFSQQKLTSGSVGKAIVIINGGTISVSPIKVNIEQNQSQTAYSNTLENYYKLALLNYDDVYKSWPAVTDSEGQAYGEKALSLSALLAGNLEKTSDQEAYLEKFLQSYPKSAQANELQIQLSSLYQNSDNSKSSALVKSLTKNIQVTLEDVSEPTNDQLSAGLLVNGQSITKGLKQSIDVSDHWIISNIIDENTLEISTLSGNVTIRLTKGQNPQRIDPNTIVKVVNINMARYAKVTLSPYSREGETFTNFTVHIGIEKRAIQLSVDQTKSLISGLDNQIKQWSDVNDRLTQIVTGWKKACFAGSGALWVGNFISNLANPGQALARTAVMSSQKIVKGGQTYNGWTDFCSNKNNQNDLGVRTVSQCLAKESSSIDSDVSTFTNAIQTTNSLLSDVLKQPGVTQNVGFFKMSTQINDIAYADAMQKLLKDRGYSQFDNANISGLLQSGYITRTDLSAAILDINAAKSCGTSSEISVCSGLTAPGTIPPEIQKVLNSVPKEAVDVKLASRFAFLGDFSNVPTIEEGLGGAKPAEILDGVKNKNLLGQPQFSNIASDQTNKIGTSQVALLNIRSIQQGQQTNYIASSYAIVLSGATAAGSTYSFDDNRVYVFNDATQKYENATQNDIKNLRKNANQIQKQDKCDYTYQNPQIQFWDTGSYKGFPAVMPLGNVPTQNSGTLRGFYVATESQGTSLTASLTSTPTSQAFAESGEPQVFWICNVGQNGKPEFNQAGSDDESCQRFSLAETYASQTSLCEGKLNKQDTSNLVKRAVTCLKQASTQYGKSTTAVKTDCGTIQIGSPKVSTPNVQCEDYMSPTSCTIMYNLCDPVICPPSRCNLAGRYPTDNVIQTGILGSLFLCLPNRNPAEGGVVVPICLTGINAGLDNLISIMKSARQCLQTSLDSGQTVGICDEIKSVYLCEFFWKEITPFVKTGIPYLVENTILGRRGGGEYLTFASAWQNSINQFNYITQYYGANALRAFQVRSTAEAGSAICQAFVGLRYPNQADLFNEMAKPESPPQINAWFDEASFSSATVPPISQYKVYWHIFAGNDEPVYWDVYLSQPQSFTYPLPERQEIASGYLDKAQSSDQTRDLTLASGYRQLCVRINLKDYCGFQKVTTGFGVNELTNYYVQAQTTPNLSVSSAQECTSGTSALLTGETLPTSLIPLITQPSEASVTQLLQPEIYRQGIIRVCSQDDPGKGVDTNRWARVGFCDNGKTVGCWLDTQSVKGAINDLYLQNLTISDAQALSLSLLDAKSGYMNETVSAQMFSDFKANITNLNNHINTDINPLSSQNTIDALITPVISQLNRFVQFSLSDKVQAESQITIAGIYDNVVLRLRSAQTTATPVTSATPIASAVAASALPCNLTDISWSKTSASPGENVLATITGTPSCAGLTVYSDEVIEQNSPVSLTNPSVIDSQGKAIVVYSIPSSYSGSLYARAFFPSSSPVISSALRVQ